MRHRPIVVITIGYILLLVLLFQVFPSWGFSKWEKREQQIQAFLESEPVLRGQVRKIEARDTGFRAFLRLSDGYEAVLLLEQKECRAGDWVEVTGRGWQMEAATNPGQWDGKAYARQNKIAFYWQVETLTVYQEGGWGWERIYEVLQEKIGGQIDRLWPDPYAGIMRSMLLGDTSNLDASVQTLYQEGGIAHIIAISGSHLTIVGELILAVLRKWQKPVFAKLETALGLWFYVWLTGASVAALRAAIMMSLKFVAQMVGREEDFLTSLSLTALLLLIIRPLALFEAGFQLSFAALLGLHYGKLGIMILPKIPYWLRTLLAPALGAHATVSPLSLWHFYQTPVWGFLLNLYVVPAMGTVLTAGLAATLLGALHPACGRGPALLVQLLLWTFEVGSQWILAMPAAVLRGKPLLSQMIAVYALLFLPYWYYARPLTSRARTWRFSAVSFVLSALVFLRPSGWQVTFLDVGQGDCAVIESGDTVWMIDAGLEYQNVIKPYLLYRGIHTIDAIIVSHPDSDHMEGFQELAADPAFEIRALIETDAAIHETAERQKLENQVLAQGGIVRKVHCGYQVQQGAVSLAVLSPSAEVVYEDENDASLVVRVEIDGFSFLFTGDASSQVERTREWPASDVLKAAHHGSRFSTDTQFLSQVNPELTILSCGRQNRYGHPHEEVLERLTQGGYAYRVTAQSGALQIRRKGNALAVRAWYNTLIER